MFTKYTHFPFFKYHVEISYNVTGFANDAVSLNDRHNSKHSLKFN